MFEVTYRYDPAHPLEGRTPRGAEEAWLLLEAGNRAFASLGGGSDARSRIVYVGPEDVGLPEPSGVPTQEPFAVVLGCSDARVPTELIFDRACNELFVVRVAGNIISQELLGSIDYAVEHMGESLKLIAVLGHSRCGAVTAAVDAYLKPAGYFGLTTSHSIRSIVNVLFRVVHGAARALATVRGDDVTRLPGYRAALTECSVFINAALTASIVREELGPAAKGLPVILGVYDLASRLVHVPLAPTSEEGEPPPHLLEAPHGREALKLFASQVANSAHITRLLRR